MNDAALLSNWYMSLALAGVIVLAAAALLILVWLAARRILKLALVALDLVKQIKANTQCIWALQDTNKVAGQLLADVEDIRDHGILVAQALHETSKESVAA